MKILAVCSFGVGSSMVLKMTIEKVLREMGIDAEVDNTDIPTAQSTQCDAIFTSYALEENLKESVKTKIFPIKKYMDVMEVKEALQKLLEKK